MDMVLRAACNAVLACAACITLFKKMDMEVYYVWYCWLYRFP
jgi:hypothetical protein